MNKPPFHAWAALAVFALDVNWLFVASVFGISRMWSVNIITAIIATMIFSAPAVIRHRRALNSAVRSSRAAMHTIGIAGVLAVLAVSIRIISELPDSMVWYLLLPIGSALFAVGVWWWRTVQKFFRAYEDELLGRCGKR